MDEYRDSYSLLFRAATCAVEAIDAQDFGTAKRLLLKAQQEAEELFINQEEKTTG